MKGNEGLKSLCARFSLSGTMQQLSTSIRNLDHNINMEIDKDGENALMGP